MPSLPTLCLPKKTPVVPEGLVRTLREKAGAAIRFFDLDGEPFPAGPDAAPEPEPPETLRRAVRKAAETDAAYRQVVPGGLVAAWPVQLRGRTILIAAAELDGLGDAAQAAGPRLLAAVAETVRARFAEADRSAQCDSLSEGLSQSFEEITLLHNVGEVLRVTRPTDSLLEYVCSELRETTGAETAVACLPDADGGKPQIVLAGNLPMHEADVPRLLTHLLHGGARCVVINNHCQDDPAIARYSDAIRRLAVVPLPLGEGPPGALAILNRPDEEFGSPDVKLIRSTANASAVFIENRRLYHDLHEMMLDLVRALVSSVDAKDPYTCGHSERVAITCRELAGELGLGDEQVEQAYMAGLLHDIGKIGTPETILRKEGRLQPEERRVIAQHPATGGRILQGATKLGAVRLAVVHHHERFDGTGYPDGLKGEDIPLLARIVGLADAFDAMTSNRPYRPLMPLEVVLDEVKQNRGTQFDPRVIDAFFRLDMDRLTEQFAEHAGSDGQADERR